MADWASACCVEVFSNEGGMVIQQLRPQTGYMTFIATRKRQIANADIPRAKG